MAAWRTVQPRIRALQAQGVAIYEDRSRWHLAYSLAGYLHGGDAVLLFSKEVNSDALPVVVPLSKLEELVRAAKRAEEYVASRRTHEKESA